MRGLLLPFCALLLLESTEGNKQYDQLSDQHKEVVAKAIERANMDFAKQFHLDFSSILKTNDENRMVNVLLKPTSCMKGLSGHQKNCEIQPRAKPQVSCVDCDGKMSCSYLFDHMKIKEAEQECLYHNGGGILLILKKR